jgi:hypothetical protein
VKLSVEQVLVEAEAERRAIARYRVYVSTWYPSKSKIVLASGLGLEEAKQRAADEFRLLKARDPNVQGRFTDPVVNFELENKEAVDAARRERNAKVRIGGGEPA